MTFYFGAFPVTLSIFPFLLEQTCLRLTYYSRRTDCDDNKAEEPPHSGNKQYERRDCERPVLHKEVNSQHKNEEAPHHGMPYK